MTFKKFTTLLLAFTMVGGNLFAQLDENKTYTIANNNDASQFIQEHDANGGSVVQVGSLSNRAYWQFEATESTNCYYIKNALTGKYLQGYSASGNEISSGDTPVEYYVKADASGNYTGKYRFAVTSLTPHDFSANTLGLNWKSANDASVDYDCIQAFQSVAGSNPRSAWTITEAEMPITTFSSTKRYSLLNYAESGFLKDDRSGTLKVEATLTSNALWVFEPSATEGRYYIKNLLTGLYIQSTASKETDLHLSNNKQEFIARADGNKGINFFALASTDQDNLNFDGTTLGINWRASSNIAQSFTAQTGSNNRSFWKVAEVPTVDFADNVDNTAAIAAAAGEGKNAVITRSMAKDMWNTLVVPHTMNPQAITRNFGEGAKVAELTAEADGVLTFATVSDISAGKPCLVKPTIDVVNIITMNTTVSTGLTTNSGNSYQFVGLYAPSIIGTEDYFMAANNTLVKNGQGGSMKAFRAYFHPATSEVKALGGFSVDGTETGIIAPDGSVHNDTRTYNLAGQQVNMKNTRKGVYIINGKKYIK